MLLRDPSPAYDAPTITDTLAVGARLWNSLPQDIVASEALSQFRCGLKTFLFRQSYPFILF